MSKRVLLLTLAVLMAVGIYTAVANAGVEGDFTFDIWMYPQTTGNELSNFQFDIEGLLNLGITLSGLTFSNDLAIGIAGLEHYIATISTTLGALDLTDEFAFAVPFVNCPYYWPSYAFYYGATCTPIGTTLFVKKRVNMDITIGGLSLSTLIMFEDVNFPWPTTAIGDPVPNPNLGQPDTYDDTYEAADQAFRFGAIMGLSGTTVSGIEVSAKTGVCADWRIRYYYFTQYYPKFYTYVQFEGYYNFIKKHAWTSAVIPTCDTLTFSKEFLAIENIPITDMITLNSYTIFEVTREFGFDSYLEGTITLPANIGTLYSWWHMTAGNLLEPAFPGNWFDLMVGPTEVIWFDAGGDLSMTPDDDVYVFTSLDIQNVSFLNGIYFVPTEGIQELFVEADIPISYPEPIGTLELTSFFEKDEAGNMVFSWIEATMVKDFGEHNELMIDATFGADGLYYLEISDTVSFSL